MSEIYQRYVLSTKQANERPDSRCGMRHSAIIKDYYIHAIPYSCLYLLSYNRFFQNFHLIVIHSFLFAFSLVKCVRKYDGYFGFGLTQIDPIFPKDNLCLKTIFEFSFPMSSTFHIWHVDLKFASQLLVSRVIYNLSTRFEVSTAHQFRVYRRHGTEGRTDRRTDGRGVTPNAAS